MTPRERADVRFLAAILAVGAALALLTILL